MLWSLGEGASAGAGAGADAGAGGDFQPIKPLKSVKPSDFPSKSL